MCASRVSSVCLIYDRRARRNHVQDPASGYNRRAGTRGLTLDSGVRRAASPPRRRSIRVRASRRVRAAPTANGSPSTAVSTRRSGSAPCRRPISRSSIRTTARRRPSAPRCASSSIAIGLYLGVLCFDSEPDKLLGNQMQRDQPFAADDRFMLALDTVPRRRTGYFFEINPSGAMGDGSGRRRASRAETGRLGVTQNRAVGRHLERSRPPHTIAAGRPRSSSRSARSTSTPTASRGASTSSAPCGARTKRACGQATCGIRGSTHVECGAAHRPRPTSTRASASTSSRTSSASITDDAAGTGATSTPPHGRRPLLQPHARAPREPHHQHRLRARPRSTTAA